MDRKRRHGEDNEEEGAGKGEATQVGEGAGGKKRENRRNTKKKNGAGSADKRRKKYEGGLEGTEDGEQSE